MTNDESRWLIPAIFTMLGVIFGGFIGLAGTWIKTKSDERNHLKRLLIDAAIENWKYVSSNSQSRKMVPLDMYIAHMMKFFDVFWDSKEKPSKENIISKLKEVNDYVDTSKKFYDDDSSK